MIDYKALLNKYMAHILDCEGWDFLQDINHHHSTVSFTAEEIRELQNISKGVQND